MKRDREDIERALDVLHGDEERVQDLPYTILMTIRFLPPDTTPDARLILMARGVRAFGDGFVSVLLPLHLTTIGLSAGQVGLVTTRHYWARRC